MIQDLRLRLVVAFLVVLGISQLHSPESAAVMLVLALALALMSKSDRAVWRRLLHLEGYVALLLIVLPFTIPGRDVLSLGPLSASVEGALRAVLVSLKISASGLVILAMLGNEAPERFGAALSALKIPSALVHMLMLTVRYLSLIREEIRRLREAMQVRGFIARSNRHTWKSYGNLIGMVLLRSIDRATRVEEAMRCRGFAGRVSYSVVASPRMSDWLGAVLLAGVAGLVLVWDLR